MWKLRWLWPLLQGHCSGSLSLALLLLHTLAQATWEKRNFSRIILVASGTRQQVHLPLAGLCRERAEVLLFPKEGVGMVGAIHFRDIKGLLQFKCSESWAAAVSYLLELIASSADQQTGLAHLPFKIPLLAFPEHGNISLLLGSWLWKMWLWVGSCLKYRAKEAPQTSSI